MQQQLVDNEAGIKRCTPLLHLPPSDHGELVPDMSLFQG